jgi:cell division GTPase FtsZ
MERRKMIKSLTAFATFALFPYVSVCGNQNNKRLHFVGLGQAGSNVMLYIHKKGINAKFSSINGWLHSPLTKDMEFILYEPSPDLAYGEPDYKKGIVLTVDMKTLFRSDDYYIILAGLGGTLGTGLIRNVLEFLTAEQKSYMAICSLPFKQEGYIRNKYAKEKAAELERFYNLAVFNPHQLVVNYLERPAAEVYRECDEQFYLIFKNHFTYFARHA